MASVTITELKRISRVSASRHNEERLHVTVRGKEVADIVPADPVRAAIWRSSRPATRWSGGEDMVVPDDLPINSGRLVSDIVLEDRGHTLMIQTLKPVIIYADTSAFVKAVLARGGRGPGARVVPRSADAGRSPASSPTPEACAALGRAPSPAQASDSDALQAQLVQRWMLSGSEYSWCR